MSDWNADAAFALGCVFGPSSVFVLPLCARTAPWLGEKGYQATARHTSACLWASVSASRCPFIRHSWQDPEPCSWQPAPFFTCSSLLLQQKCAFFLSHEIKTRQGVVKPLSDRTPHPPHTVTWINSCTHDEAPAVARGTLRGSLPTLTLPPLLPYSSLASGLLHEAHSSAQCWNTSESANICWHLCPSNAQQVCRDLPQQKESRGWPRSVAARMKLWNNVCVAGFIGGDGLSFTALTKCLRW